METMATESKHSAGELLRQGRLRQRLSIAECAKRTHIASRYLEALEEERWNALPSESHRLGFLKLYSRFLGVPVEEILTLYRQKAKPVPEEAAAPTMPKRGAPAGAKSASRSAHWSPSSIPQVIGLAILGLLSAWLIYHAVSPRLFEQNPMPWVRRRSPHQSRLIVPKTSMSSQKVRIKAEADSWLRVTTNNELLFEGILPAGTVKEWSGPGPFQFKVGNVRALSLFWNDQSVDILSGARGATNEIRIPPP
jgi:transcriptional regulator with XRE-family HTH domain